MKQNNDAHDFVNLHEYEEAPMVIDVPPIELWEDDAWIVEFQVKLRKLQRKQRFYSFVSDLAVAGITIITVLTAIFFILQEG